MRSSKQERALSRKDRGRAWGFALGVWISAFALLAAVATALARAPETPPESYADKPELRLFIDSMAEKHGFDPASLEGLFSRARFQPGIIRAMTQSARGKTWDDYRPLFVNPDRVQRGVRFWNDHAAALAKAREVFGVPEEVITAIIGIETHYGKNTGSFRVLDALTTLAFEYPPRAETFRAELEQYLLLTREGEHVGLLNAKGSYAGAMGIAQFMPGSYRYYAVDFDGDGRRDLIGNTTDAIGSVANYLSRHGWRHGERTVVRARVTGEHYLPYANSGLELNYIVAQWKWLGVAPLDELGGGEEAILFSLRTQNGPEYWLGLNNFYVITRYNRSSYYAMAVHELGREIRSLREQPGDAAP